MRVAYAGVPGAFAHQACLAFVPDHEPLAVSSFGEVIAAVERGDAELGMLPVENSRVGPVEESTALLRASSLRVVAEHGLPVRMHLLGLPGATLESIVTVVSHPVALAQCAATLAELGLATEEARNTAVAAAELRDPRKAVLASEPAADAYGLVILRRDVHDDRDNVTRFAILMR